ncbi:hypothetical protein WA026_014315 [Henosepilachna vigintioctopunctata]|uniref:Uncharacterized protein n=1 Tax=Henosepilachna vigintioctopunctata TaxID=420089 RepID=A0AAW1UNE1_9CUCU
MINWAETAECKPLFQYSASEQYSQNNNSRVISEQNGRVTVSEIILKIKDEISTVLDLNNRSKISLYGAYCCLRPPSDKDVLVTPSTLASASFFGKCNVSTRTCVNSEGLSCYLFQVDAMQKEV